jgi:hypothetical protein
MGQGIRPKGHFSYADLRYKDAKPACKNNEPARPAKYLCQQCVHNDCNCRADKSKVGADKKTKGAKSCRKERTR